MGHLEESDHAHKTIHNWNKNTMIEKKTPCEKTTT